LAIEFTSNRLRVNAVCPGGMRTAQVTEFAAPENADWNLIMRIASPRGFMDVTDVAKTIAFLSSDDAAAVHGAVYVVDNGKTAG
jgi:NAD(P)-dependent dehydrogenase (short-subunit alcohol dehydrogenase family)